MVSFVEPSCFTFFCHRLLLVFLYMYMFTVYMYVQPPAFLAISRERPPRVILAPLSGNNQQDRQKYSPVQELSHAMFPSGRRTTIL